MKTNCDICGKEILNKEITIYCGGEGDGGIDYGGETILDDGCFCSTDCLKKELDRIISDLKEE